MFEFPIIFKDPAAVYAFFLISNHQSVMWYLIIILVLVYGCLYTIIRDFRWVTYNLSSNIFTQVTCNSVIKHLEIYIVYIWVYLLVEIFLSYTKVVEWMEEKTTLDSKWHVIYPILKAYLSFIEFIFGLKFVTRYVEYLPIFDINGKLLFDDEEFFDAKNKYTFYTAMFLAFKEDFTLESAEYVINDKYVSSSIYNYTVQGYFLNGQVNNNSYYVKKNLNFLSISNFSIIDITNILFNAQIELPVLEYDKVFLKPSNLLLNELLEEQEFKHSLSFELIWTSFPTIIILGILVPSLYLLYSLDEDLNPKLTFKVIGHHDIDRMNLIIE